MQHNYFIFFVFCLFPLLFRAQNCDQYKTTFGCQEILACGDTSGVCQCPNGNQCSWNLNGLQTVNCPCFDFDQGFKPYNTTDYCISQFITQNCGYETACNEVASVGSCQCPDGQSSCIWNSQQNLSCPCGGNYLSLVSYRNAKFQACSNAIQGYKCDSNGVINCVRGSGSCTCTDGSLCSWGNGYAKGCPCGSAKEDIETVNSQGIKKENKEEIEL